MFRKFLLLLFFSSLLILFSCSRKSHPSKASSSTPVTKNADSSVTVKPVKPKPVPLAKVISVNDSAAHKSVDGRLYYDVMGHRYWKNYKDGKYYLFNKSMYNDSAFNKPG